MSNRDGNLYAIFSTFQVDFSNIICFYFIFFFRPVPDGPFPRLNSSRTLKRKLVTFDIIGALTTIASYGSLAFCLYGIATGNYDMISTAFYFAIVANVTAMLAIGVMIALTG